MIIDVSKKYCFVGNAISNSSLVQMVKKETFFCNEHPISLLDLVLVSDPNRVTDVKRGPSLDGNSYIYHCSLSFQLHSRAARSQAFDIRTLHWRSGDFAAMSEYFKNYNWQGAVQKGSLQNFYSNFLVIFDEAAKLFVKRRRKKPFNAKPTWWNYEVARRDVPISASVSTVTMSSWEASTEIYARE